MCWQKVSGPPAPFPPASLGKLTGFRDPFVFARKTNTSPWKIIVGSGISGKCGTVLVYHAQNLSKGRGSRAAAPGQALEIFDGALRVVQAGTLWGSLQKAHPSHAKTARTTIWALCGSAPSLLSWPKPPLLERPRTICGCSVSRRIPIIEATGPQIPASIGLAPLGATNSIWGKLQVIVS